MQSTAVDLPVSPRDVFVDAERHIAAQSDLSPFRVIATYNIAIFYMLWYFAVCHWNLVNYVAWVRFNGSLLGSTPSPQLYLAFVVIALFTFWVIGGFLLYRAAKYAETQKQRYHYLSAAVSIMYVFTDVPLWLNDITIVYWYGFVNQIQSIALILRSISFVGNSIVVWHIYMHRMVKFLHTRLWAHQVDAREIARRKARSASSSRFRNSRARPSR